MAKGYKDSVGKLKNALRSEQREVEIENSLGVKVKIKALSPYLVQMALESVDRPDVPTYTITTVDGSLETFPYDQESIDQTEDETEKKRWQKYLDESRQADIRASEILLNVILIEGIDMQIENEDSWLKRQKLMGIRVPDDPEERLLIYKKQKVIASESDVELITKKVMELTGVSREEVDLVKNSFQDTVEPDA